MVKKFYSYTLESIVCSKCSGKAIFNHQLNDETQTGDIKMNNTDNQYLGPSVTLSVMISEAVYRAVVGVERIIRLITR